MERRIPEVSLKDVQRVIERDFGSSQHERVMSVLLGFEGVVHEHVRARVLLSVLKMADGDIEKVEKYVLLALKDYRDVLAMAEYPGWAREDGIEPLDEATEQEVIREDWLQYIDWLNRK